MQLSELIKAFRIRADDTKKPYLWTDDEITFYLNESQNEAATRALLIQDSSTPEVTQIQLQVGVGIYLLHESVLTINSTKLADGTKLIVTSQEELEGFGHDVENAAGVPKYVFENGDGNVTITPKPIAVDTVTLQVHRLPLCAMKGQGDCPEIHSRYHHRMIDWALRCAYLKTDADTYDPGRAALFEQKFEDSFGYFHDANVQRKHRDKSPNQVRSSW